MFTFYGTFRRQKRSKKKEFSRLEFTFDEFYINPSMDNTESATEAKGFVLVDKRGQETSVYLDTNHNGKLNKKKDLLIGIDAFDESLYKAKKGSLHGTNDDDAMEAAQIELNVEAADFDFGEGSIFTNNRGRSVGYILLDSLFPVVCMMQPGIGGEDLQSDCADVGVEYI